MELILNNNDIKSIIAQCNLSPDLRVKFELWNLPPVSDWIEFHTKASDGEVCDLEFNDLCGMYHSEGILTIVFSHYGMDGAGECSISIPFAEYKDQLKAIINQM